MFDHVTIRVSDHQASERFYDTVLATLGVAKSHARDAFAEWSDFSLAQAEEADRVTSRLHIGFRAPTRKRVDEFWSAGTAAGHRDDGAPGPRPQYSERYYGAFLLDPDGNRAEAVHDIRPPGGVIDHLWIRVADLAASREFYETIAPHTGFRATAHLDDRVRFSAPGATFSIVSGSSPTAGLHMAFPAPDDATVDAFHRAATNEGHRSDGGPGERPEYHPGYYGAYVLDPDGNSVEVVQHNR